MVLSIVLVGMFSQETYNALGEELSSISSEYSVGGAGTIEGAWVLFSTIMTGGLSNQTAEVQQVYSVLLALLLWLATVWALRNIVAGNKIRARDALYNSGSPIISTFLIVLFGFLQLLPFTIMLLVFSAANSSGLLELPIAAALSWLTVGLSGLLTLYWLGATLMSLVVVSLPGMYPWAAIRAASDLVLGRRLVIMYRFIWLSICVAVVWVIVMLTSILLVNWLTSLWGWFANIPVVPVLLVGLTTGTMIYGAAYVYMLYRGIVDGLETE